MPKQTLAFIVLLAVACLSPTNVQAKFDPIAPLNSPAANSNCSGEGPAEILSLQPDGSVTVSILVLAEETTGQATKPVAVAQWPAVAPVQVPAPQFQIQAPVYSVPAAPFYPTYQPQAAVCTSGG